MNEWSNITMGADGGSILSRLRRDLDGATGITGVA